MRCISNMREFCDWLHFIDNWTVLRRPAGRVGCSLSAYPSWPKSSALARWSTPTLCGCSTLLDCWPVIGNVSR